MKETSFPEFRWRDLIRAYWFILGDTKWKWLGLVSFLLLISLYTVVPAFIIGKIVDFFTIYKSEDSLRYFYILTSILGISFVIVSFLRLSTKNIIGNLQSEVLYQTRVKGFEKLLDFSLGWHLEESAGSKSQKIRNGVEAFKTLNHHVTNEIMRSFTAVIGVIVVFSFLRPQYIIFFLIYILGFATLLVLFYKRIRKENDLYYLSMEKAGGSYIEGLSNILTIKTLGADADFKRHIGTKELVTKEYEIKIRRLFNNLWKCFQAFNGICYGIFLLLVGRDVIEQNITAGSMVIFYGYLQTLVGNASDMMDTYGVVLDSKSGIGRMMQIFWAKTSIATGDKQLPQDWKALVVENATFSYRQPSDKEGIRDVNLTVPRYAKIGIVGKTGSGKSTFAKILAGLYPLSSGTYSVGDISFYDLTHEEQTNKITLVLQETEIFNLSLRENITLMREVSPALLQEALTISQLDDVVEKLPQGMDTVVGERGYHLSGGERQRVGIARAICKNSPVLILDEATSSLDSKTEILIQDALETKLKDRTVISIAHRVSTLQKTDSVYVFNAGKIVESGTFDELSTNKNSHFFDLYNTQQQSSTSGSSL
ncbi:ABC transporter ATP-binding protein [Acetobacteraceae bacterium]|nr:ABC transporter ATP-binding protein [Candidatus Parcubacteria bacterium]